MAELFGSKKEEVKTSRPKKATELKKEEMTEVKTEPVEAAPETKPAETVSKKKGE